MAEQVKMGKSVTGWAKIKWFEMQFKAEWVITKRAKMERAISEWVKSGRATSEMVEK